MSIVVNRTPPPAMVYKTASGAIVSVSDAKAKPAQSLVVSMSPVQDLHGQSNPWPAGGGKNKCSMPDTTFVQFTEVEIDEIPAGTYIYSGIVTSNDTDSDNCAIIFLDAEKNTLSSKVLSRSAGTTRVATSSFTTSVPIKYLRLYASSGYPSGAGDTASFKDNMIESGSTATAWQPYSNICPISGRSEVNVTRTGKNLLEPKFYSGFQYNVNVGSSVVGSGEIVDITDSVTKSGDTYTKSGAGWTVPMSMILYVNHQFWGKTVKFSGTVEHISGFRSAYYLVDSNNILLAKSGSMNEDPTWTIAIPENTAYIVWYLNTSSAGTMKITEPMIELGSTASSYEPYSGDTFECVFGVVGKNLFDGAFEQGNISTVDGGNTSSTNNVRTKNHIPIKPNTTYFYQKKSSIYGFYIYVYDANKTFLRFIDGNGSGSTFASQESDYYLRFRYNSTGDVSDLEAQGVMLSEGSSRQIYEAYNDTVYGGTIDFVSGQLRATHLYYVIDGVNNYFVSNVSNTYWNVNPYGISELNYTQVNTYNKCNICLPNKFSYNSTSSFLYTLSSSWSGLFSTADEFNAFCQQTPIQYVARLATPVTYQLTPQEIMMLQKNDVVWADSGDVEVIYAARRS